MGMRCSRVGCGADAVASFCFDGRAALVWLDPLDPARGLGAGVLCSRHADTLTPPRGWHLQDRRVRSPRLWDDRPAPAPTAARPPLRVVHADDERAASPSPDPLPFPDGTLAAAPGDRCEADAPAGDIDQMLTARTPLLVRAFAGSVIERDGP
ncbi:MAG TPA: DUF3499 family protein [Acidimicrobiia bacterium]|jgi:hypothetical protein